MSSLGELPEVRRLFLHTAKDDIELLPLRNLYGLLDDLVGLHVLHHGAESSVLVVVPHYLVQDLLLLHWLTEDQGLLYHVGGLLVHGHGEYLPTTLLVDLGHLLVIALLEDVLDCVVSLLVLR